MDHDENSNDKHLSGACHVPGAMLHILQFIYDYMCLYLRICNNLNGYLFFIVNVVSDLKPGFISPALRPS